MKLLLATDGSPDATAALTAAARVFRHEDLEADLLSIVPPFDPAETEKGRKRTWNRIRKACSAAMTREAERVLAVALEALRAEGIAARPRTAEGSAVDVILRWSAAYDVVALGAHDRFGRTQPGVGPVGTQVILRSPASIFVGRELVHASISRILVCVDGSSSSKQALLQLTSRVRMDRAEVGVLHVVELPWLRLGLDPDWPSDRGVLGEDDYASLDGALRSGSERIVEEARSELERQGVSTAPILKEGLPEAQILSEADVGEYDLIVLGATGRSKRTRALL